MKKHQKHAKLNRPSYGEFGREEWALIGAPCDQIQQLAGQLIHRLSGEFSLAYVDADHRSGEAEQHPALKAGGSVSYTDKISHHQLEWKGERSPFRFRRLFQGAEGILVNGNHFRASRQIVILHPAKKDSLRRKLDRLTDVRLILTTEGQQQPWDFLLEHKPEWKDLPKLPLSDPKAVANWLRTSLGQAVPPVRGLVLAGGKSTRMGRDKGELEYHGTPQREYLADLLAPLCEEVFLSIRQGQRLESGYPALEDSFTGLGPYGAILSAFRNQPDSAWLVVACDLPLLNEAAVRSLLEGRNPSRVATAYYNPATDFPEPLITLWEPRAYPEMLQFLAQGFSCPRKVLINSDIELLRPADPGVLTNVNTPEDYEQVIQRLRGVEK